MSNKVKKKKSKKRKPRDIYLSQSGKKPFLSPDYIAGNCITGGTTKKSKNVSFLNIFNAGYYSLLQRHIVTVEEKLKERHFDRNVLKPYINKTVVLSGTISDVKKKKDSYKILLSYPKVHGTVDEKALSNRPYHKIDDYTIFPTQLEFDTHIWVDISDIGVVVDKDEVEENYDNGIEGLKNFTLSFVAGSILSLEAKVIEYKGVTNDGYGTKLGFEVQNLIDSYMFFTDSKKETTFDYFTKRSSVGRKVSSRCIASYYNKLGTINSKYFLFTINFTELRSKSLILHSNSIVSNALRRFSKITSSGFSIKEQVSDMIDVWYKDMLLYSPDAHEIYNYRLYSKNRLTMSFSEDIEKAFKEYVKIKSEFDNLSKKDRGLF